MLTARCGGLVVLVVLSPFLVLTWWANLVVITEVGGVGGYVVNVVMLEGISEILSSSSSLR